MDEVVKQPREVVDYTIDARDWFREIPGVGLDEVVDVQIEIDVQGDPDDLVSGPGTQAVWQPVGSPVREVKCWFGDGRDGIEYMVTAELTTAQGRVEVFKWLVRVEEQQ